MKLDARLKALLGIELPILQAPMAGAQGAELAIAVSEAGGLGSLPCAMLGADEVRRELDRIRARTRKPINLNFFCHAPSPSDPKREEAWRARLAAYYSELGADPHGAPAGPGRAPFDAAMMAVVEEFHPEVVSFHFGLPQPSLLDRVKAAGATVLSSATTVDEARWLEAHGCDVVIAQGSEAGGHRGMFLAQDPATQVGTMALVPQIAHAVKVPVVAAGGIADARGIIAALALGASAVQIGTAYLFCPEATISKAHRAALAVAKADETVLTNVFSGRPARGIVNRFVREIGPISNVAPEFPRAGPAVVPLRTAAEAKGSPDFSQWWSGQAAPLCRAMPAATLTQTLAHEANEVLARLAALAD